jgi:hypothetical protein
LGLLTTVKPPALRERHDYVAYFPIQAEASIMGSATLYARYLGN